ncbi:hypothetical protein NA57DRAFT_78661 [Rhizodiscina lignyota]|uniref:Phosphatidylserine decarboxylase n=1 Tax=Rhizodiscina lignyota TaxID=1504668 RepID=A0A9P4IBJ7_9PEZI|nr:hypothetical protein NA57DRAFT_78661 [Rhizodiscina lignyota]
MDFEEQALGAKLDVGVSFGTKPAAQTPARICPVTLPEEIDPFVSNGLETALGEEWLSILDGAVDIARQKHQIQELFDWEITDGTAFAKFASGMLKWVPTENASAKVTYDVICLFYFVFDQSSDIVYQTKIDTASINQDGSVKITPLSKWMVDFAQKIGEFMDSPDSLTVESFQTFAGSPLYHLEQAEIPDEGFKTFNELFARKLKEGMRPVSCPDDDRVIVYPADSTFDGAWPVDNGTVSIKGLDWPISALLENSDHADSFDGGIWMHAFLNTFDYHRQHAPVSGTVVEAKNIMGLAYLNVIPETIDGETHLRPHRNFNKYGDDDLDAPDDPGYQFLQLRGSVVIQNDILGYVAVLPIGMAQVSSVVLNEAIVPSSDNPRPTVKKGDEISHFEFGGSDIVLVFQAAAKPLILGANSGVNGQKYLVGEPLGVAGLGA